MALLFAAPPLVPGAGATTASGTAPATATTGATAGATASPTGPTPTQINATQSQVSAIEAKIAQQQQQTAALSQQSDAAVQQLQTINTDLATTNAGLRTTRANITADRANLARDAVHAYVLGTAGTQISTIFANPADQSGNRTEYENTVIGDVSADAAALAKEKARLAATQASQLSQERAAQTEATQAQSLEQSNAAAAAAAQATLNQVQGTLAQQVAAAAEAQAKKEAAAAAAAKSAAAAAAAAAAASAAAGVAGAVGGKTAAAAATTAANHATASAGQAGAGGTGPTGGTGPPATNVGPNGTSTSAGNAAVQAAVSQLGVPYQWGGESPGQGFDCSGLTQWAWSQAGASIPRTAASQYASVPHVALSTLEPGDLLFYFNLDGDNIVDHVVMYVGSGPYGGQTIIQAPYTGATVSYDLLYTYGLIGAGRPSTTGRAFDRHPGRRKACRRRTAIDSRGAPLPMGRPARRR